MTILTASGNSIHLTTPSDLTLVVAPGVTDLGLDAVNQGARLVNYGTLIASSYPVGFEAGSSGIFINKAEGVVIATGPFGNTPGVLIKSVASVINEGAILSESHGISIVGSANDDSIVNSGDISAALNGIFVSASTALKVTINNSGEIWGDANGIHMDGASGAAPVIFNSGVIGARFSSIIATSGDRLNVTNTGTLQGNVVGTSANAADTVVNNGKIVGDVMLGSGVDSYRGTGLVTGVVFGEVGNDKLSGGNSADRLAGGNNSDTLIGGLGNDFLQGDASNDFFVFNTTPNSSTNHDTVTDFVHGVDKLQMENAVFAKLGAGAPHALNPAFFFAGAAAHDANDYLVYNKATGALFYDSNGNAAGGAVLVAVMTSLVKPVLTASDFQVI